MKDIRTLSALEALKAHRKCELAPNITVRMLLDIVHDKLEAEAINKRTPASEVLGAHRHIRIKQYPMLPARELQVVSNIVEEMGYNCDPDAEGLREWEDGHRRNGWTLTQVEPMGEFVRKTWHKLPPCTLPADCELQKEIDAQPSLDQFIASRQARYVRQEFRPSFDMPVTAQEAIEVINAWGSEACMTFSAKRAKACADLLAAAANRTNGYA